LLQALKKELIIVFNEYPIHILCCEIILWSGFMTMSRYLSHRARLSISGLSRRLSLGTSFLYLSSNFAIVSPRISEACFLISPSRCIRSSYMKFSVRSFCLWVRYVVYSLNTLRYDLMFFQLFSLLADSRRRFNDSFELSLYMRSILWLIAIYLKFCVTSFPKRRALSFSSTYLSSLFTRVVSIPLLIMKSSKSLSFSYTLLYLFSLASSTLSSLSRITWNESERE